MSTAPPNSRTRALALLFFGLVLLLALLWGTRPLIHDDLFLHLSTGQYIAENLRVPTTDPFSFTRLGEPWVSHEWGFGVVIYCVWSLTGYWGLVALKAAVIVGILVLLFDLMLRALGVSFAAAPVELVALLAVGLWAVNDQLVLRASLFSCLFILLLMRLLLWFDRTGGRFPMLAVAGLFLLWGNFHGEVVFGLVALGLVTLESLAGRWLERGSGARPYLQVRADRPYLLLLAGSLVFSLVNPNGIQVLLYPFRLARFLFVGDVPLEMGHFTGASPAAMPAFYLLLAILLWSLLPLDRARALSMTQIIMVVAFFVLSLRSHRFIFYFALLTLPMIARLASRPAGRITASHRWRQARQLLVGLAAIAVATACLNAWQSHPRTAVSRHFPTGVVRFLDRHDIEERFFNHQNYGGYLHWNLSTPVFWDGRNLLFASLMEEVRHQSLEKVSEDWGLEVLVLTEFEYARLFDQLDPARWGLVYWDDFAAVYLRRNERFDEILASDELRHFPPFGGIEGLERQAQDTALAVALERELDRVLAAEPDSQRALYLLGLIRFYRGDPQEAEGLLREALAIGPNEFIDRALARVTARRATG